MRPLLVRLADSRSGKSSPRCDRGFGRGKHLGCPYLPNAKAEKIKNLRESGLSFRKIASQVKVSVGTAVAYCK